MAKNMNFFYNVASPQMSFYSGYYENDTDPHVICIPFTFAKFLSETYTYTVTVNGNNFRGIDVPSDIKRIFDQDACQWYATVLGA